MPRAAVVLLVALSLTLGLTTSSAGNPPLGRVCTLVGCRSAVFIDVRQVVKSMPAARTIDVCIDSRCNRAPLYDPSFPGARETVTSRENGIHAVGPYVVSIVLRDRRGKVLVRAGRIVTMEKNYPNGKECGGLCFDRSLKLTARRELIVQPS